MPDETCENCRCWRRVNGEAGQCRSHAPAPVLTPSPPAWYAVAWPPIRATDWCGQWQPLPVRTPKDRPRITCLVGSTRFRAAYEQAFRDEEHAGRVCLTVPCYKDDHCCKTVAAQEALDRLHRHKIDMADALLVVSEGAYLGESTRREIAYALSVGKPVRWLEDEARRNYFATTEGPGDAQA